MQLCVFSFLKKITKLISQVYYFYIKKLFLIFLFSLFCEKWFGNNHVSYILNCKRYHNFIFVLKLLIHYSFNNKILIYTMCHIIITSEGDQFSTVFFLKTLF